MIQITATDVNDNSRQFTMYLQKVNHVNNLDTWRLIWVEDGHTQHSVASFPTTEPLLNIIHTLYNNPKGDSPSL